MTVTRYPQVPRNTITATGRNWRRGRYAVRRSFDAYTFVLVLREYRPEVWIAIDEPARPQLVRYRGGRGRAGPRRPRASAGTQHRAPGSDHDGVHEGDRRPPERGAPADRERRCRQEPGRVPTPRSCGSSTGRRRPPLPPDSGTATRGSGRAGRGAGGLGAVQVERLYVTAVTIGRTSEGRLQEPGTPAARVRGDR